MITDKEMIELGFEKVKVLRRKKETGVSTYEWEYRESSFRLKQAKWNNDDYFSPALVMDRCSFFYKDIKHVEILLKALFIIKEPTEIIEGIY